MSFLTQDQIKQLDREVGEWHRDLVRAEADRWIDKAMNRPPLAKNQVDRARNKRRRERSEGR